MKGANLHLASVFLVPYTPIMKTLSIPYPESLLGSLHVSEGEFAREARMAMAVKLFDTGKLSSGQAADLADMPRVHLFMNSDAGASPPCRRVRTSWRVT